MNYALRIVVFLLVGSIAAGAITGSQLYYRLSYLWGFILFGSLVMSYGALRGIKITRIPSSLRSSVGQIFEERYELRNNGRLPRLWIEVKNESSLPKSHGSHVLTMIGGGESHSFLARTWLRERGVFPLGPTVLRSGDPFGLFPVKRNFPNQESLLVLPMMVDVRSFPNPPGLLPGGDTLRRRTNQITSNAYGVREYEAGDPLNRIHWLSTARRDKLISKEFELDPLGDVWIVLDAAENVHSEVPQPVQDFSPQDVWHKRTEFRLPASTLEYGVSIAASLVRFYLRQKRAVGFVSDGSNIQIIPSDRGGRQLIKILEALALIKADGKIPLQNLVEAQIRHLPRGSTLVIITPSVSEGVSAIADLILKRGLRPVMVLLNRKSFGGSYSSEVEAATFKGMGVPYYYVNNGDDLTLVLSN